jgi:hypothetical protein
MSEDFERLKNFFDENCKIIEKDFDEIWRKFRTSQESLICVLRYANSSNSLKNLILSGVNRMLIGLPSKEPKNNEVKILVNNITDLLDELPKYFYDSDFKKSEDKINLYKKKFDEEYQKYNKHKDTYKLEDDLKNLLENYIEYAIEFYIMELKFYKFRKTNLEGFFKDQKDINKCPKCEMEKKIDIIKNDIKNYKESHDIFFNQTENFGSDCINYSYPSWDRLYYIHEIKLNK